MVGIGWRRSATLMAQTSGVVQALSDNVKRKPKRVKK